MRFFQRHMLLLILLGILPACANHSMQQQSAALGFTPQVMRGSDFLHQLATRDGAGDVLHVYIEGDGRPWLQPHRVAKDPTPARVLMLELMALDPAPALFLGRPCYFAVPDSACAANWWTDQRYAQEVIDSMDAILDSVAAEYNGLLLIGHSGGGTLAMLLAGRRKDVRGLVTLAGNLDIDRWAQEHQYTPLRGSVNPAWQPPLASHIGQWHYLGAGDETITADMIVPVIQKQYDASYYLLPGVDHNCCWADNWQAILAQVLLR